MFQASVFVGTSLDGFIARENGALDFRPPDGGEPHGYEEFVASVDAFLFGRLTYETVLSFQSPVWPYGERPVYVLSSRPLKPAPPDARVYHLVGTPHEVASELATRGVRHVYVDGGFTIQSFLRAGLVRRIVVTRVPVLIGSGIPLFGALPHDIPLEHVLTRSFTSGLVQSEYRVEPHT